MGRARRGAAPLPICLRAGRMPDPRRGPAEARRSDRALPDAARPRWRPTDPRGADLTRAGVVARPGARILRELVACVIGRRRSAACRRTRSWPRIGGSTQPGADLVRRCLVLHRRSRAQRLDVCRALRRLDRGDALRRRVGGARRVVGAAPRRRRGARRGDVSRAQRERRPDHGDGRAARARRGSAGDRPAALSRRRPARRRHPLRAVGCTVPQARRLVGRRARMSISRWPRRRPRWVCRRAPRSACLSSAARSAGSRTRSSNTKAAS